MTTTKEDGMTEAEVLAQVREGLAEIKVPGAESAAMETTWQELDVDSLDLVELVRMLEDHYGIEIADEKLDGIASVGDAVRLILGISQENAPA